ncbi:hypothetical protein [Kitasatospora camelliae]|uniref:Uncharacterized protein n=1 Tax=Kitasatospora camelliae TaxID=3156397 RepID=A0AAU8K4M4_9ACTN
MTQPLDLDAIEQLTNAALDPASCGSCRHHAERGRAVIHEQCIARATLLPAPDAPGYETILDTPEDQRAQLPARFHIPVYDDLGTPKSWKCAVCWGDGWGTAWPCATALENGRDVFTPEHMAERSRADVPALVVEVRWLRAESEQTRQQHSMAIEAWNSGDISADAALILIKKALGV